MTMRFPRPVHLAIAAAAGVAVGGTAVYVWTSSRRREIISTREAASPLRALELEHPALKHGVPRTTHFRTFSSYVAEYDPRLRNPRYVLEHFTPEVLRGDGNRNNSFFKEDSTLDPRFRSHLDDYRNSGYDRGHMAPAANHKRSQEAMDDTFILTNTCPQVGQGFNRDYWARFERFVQKVAERCDDVFVVTGPCYLPQPGPAGWAMKHSMLGQPPRMQAVPTHFYKVVLGERRNGSTDSTVLGAFVLPNMPIDPKTPLASFAVPVSSLEEVVGISFFPKFLEKEKRLAVDQVSLQWQRIGHAELSQLKLPAGSGGVGATGSPPLLPPPPSSVIAIPELKPKSPGYGMEHICERNGCRLPGERWWEANKKAVAKDLRRTKSSPALARAMPPK
ncbi:putative Mitochondrial nuclease [Nannochloris sp. 'desiccata']|nr:putative Mitochondrial nuclease [Chlorella desiccata (nom. nud.)]